MLVLALTLPFIGFTQESTLGNWLIYIGNTKLNSEWNIHSEVQYRNYDFIGDLEQLLLRTGLGYNVADKSNALLGYGFIQSENYIGDSDDKFSVSEHRIFQQFTTNQNIGVVKFNHRYRFEQRFIESDFKMRFRYFLGLNVPLQKSKPDKKPLYFSAYNEIFLNTDSAVFDRNRVYLGLGYSINKRLRLELGYMNQFFEKDSRDQINVITFVNF